MAIPYYVRRGHWGFYMYLGDSGGGSSRHSCRVLGSFYNLLDRRLYEFTTRAEGPSWNQGQNRNRYNYYPTHPSEGTAPLTYRHMPRLHPTEK